MLSAKRTYSFEARISSLLNSGSTDQLYFRLCVDTLCSTFTDVIWNNSGNAYRYNVTTPTNYGTINGIQIVHTGDDMLCLDYIKVDEAIYYESSVDLSYCWDAGTGGDACNTLTISSTNVWSKKKSNPCEYASQFDAITIPTEEPTNSPTNTSSIIVTNSQSASTINPIIILITESMTVPTTPTPYNLRSNDDDEQHTKHNQIDLLVIIIVLSISLVTMILIICGIAFYFVYQRGIQKGMEINKDDKNGEEINLSVEHNVSSQIHIDDMKDIMDGIQDEGDNDTDHFIDDVNGKEVLINNVNEKEKLSNNNDALLIPGNIVGDKYYNTPNVSEIGAMEMRKKVLKKVDCLDDLYEPIEDNTSGYIQNNEEMAMEKK